MFTDFPVEYPLYTGHTQTDPTAGDETKEENLKRITLIEIVAIVLILIVCGVRLPALMTEARMQINGEVIEKPASITSLDTNIVAGIRADCKVNVPVNGN